MRGNEKLRFSFVPLNPAPSDTTYLGLSVQRDALSARNLQTNRRKMPAADDLGEIPKRKRGRPPKPQPLASLAPGPAVQGTLESQGSRQDSPKPQRRRGGQPGNSNAVRHNLYGRGMRTLHAELRRLSAATKLKLLLAMMDQRRG